MKKMIWAMMAIILPAASCSDNDGPTPEPPTPPVVPDDTIPAYPETPESAPTKFTGYEHLQSDTIPDGWVGYIFMKWPHIYIQDEHGTNLLEEGAEGNLRDNDFQLICEGKIYHKDAYLPGFWRQCRPFGYTAQGTGNVRKYDFLVLGTLMQWVYDRGSKYEDFMFLWPEKAYSCYIRIHQEGRRIKIPEGWKNRENPDSATILSWGMFVNGYAAPVDPASGINLVVMDDGSIKATYTKWVSK